jgi:Secretion system C-terminal sorting domain
MKINKMVLIFSLQLILAAGVLAKSDTKCGTIPALESFRLGVKLLRPPSGPKYVYSTHFIIHFDTTGSGSCTRAYAESTSKYAEYSWAKEVDTLNWGSPPPDGSNGGDSRYDIYITNLSYLGVTITESWYTDPYPDGATSYIEVDHSITPFPGELEVTVAHEFNHACQFRYSAVEDNFWYENCATWMEDMCYDNINDYVNYLLYSTPNPLDSTYLPINTETNLYWYAGALWPMFLQECFGDSCPRKSWERMGTVSGGNTLTGIDYALSNYFGSNLTNALKKYGVWRYFTGTRADITYHFSESNLWPTSSLLATHNLYPASGDQGSRPPSGPGGTDFVRFNPGTGGLTITFDGQNGYDWGAFAIGYRVPAQSIEQEISLNANDSGSTYMSWTGNSHIALIPTVTYWTGSANNLTFTYNAVQQTLQDVGVSQIIAPTGSIDSGTIVTPQTVVKNFGSGSASFPVTFRIGSVYNNTQNVNNLAPGDSFLVNFSPWTALQRGTQTTKCTTALTGDQNATNDMMTGSVLVQVINVGVTEIVIPSGIIDSTAQVFPRVKVKNYGTNTENFNVTFRIFSTAYIQTRTKTLNAGIEDTVNFSVWQPVRGTYSTRCTTNLTGDMYRANDTLNGSFTVRVRDVGVTAIEVPTGTIDSGMVITPRVRVRNNGTDTETFPVSFRIGTFYTSSPRTKTLASGVEDTVLFSDWSAVERGSWSTKCTTALTGDQIPANNSLSGSVSVRVLDVACLAILAPTGTIDSGSFVIPVAQVKNNGTQSATFSLTFKIGSIYTDTRTKTLSAGIIDTASFSSWQANQIGTYMTQCTTAFTGDMVPGNNAVSDSVSVQFGVIPDVGVTQIIAPIDTVDSGAVITPQAMVKNFGNTQQTFPVSFRIGTFYNNTRSVNNLNPGDSAIISFTDWISLPRGTHTTKCTTALNGDINATNNAFNGSVIVQVNDVGITQIIAPSGVLDSGAVVTPQARIKNFGTSIVSFPVTFQVGSFYSDLQNVSTLNPGESTLVNFVPCTLAQSGIQPTLCATGLSADQNSLNDTLTSSITVFTRDVGVVQILAPSGTIGPGSSVNPRARVANFGVYSENFLVYFRIFSSDTIYYDSSNVTIEPDRDSILDFSVWNAIPGSYKSYVRTFLAGDQIPDNDTSTNRFFVSEVGWQPMVNVPSSPSGKNPKNGTCITGLDGKIYLLKANNTSDFYEFTPDQSSGSWATLTAIPLGDKETGDGKNPKKGAALSAYNNVIYALRGNNKPGFWSYVTNGAGWLKLANIPTGAKNPKGGSGIVYVNKTGTDYIFAMKGSKTTEFYLYEINGNTWQPTASPGVGLSGRPGYKDGSCLAYDGDSLVYVMKGNYGDFFEYNVIRNTWTELRRLDPAGYRNRNGKKKKVKDGAGLTFLNGAVYLLKSGNTLEFWKYDIGANNWFQMNPANIWDIPIGGGKKVKSGSALCILDNCFYALKGNNTAEFYKHNQPADEITSITNPIISGAQEQKSTLSNDFKISIIPNPANNITSVKYELPEVRSVKLRLYNCYGGLVKSYNNSTPTRNGIFIVDLKELSSGIYMIEFESGNNLIPQKLVINK